MAWYRAGTVTVSNGSNVVTGTGTQWANNVHVGDAIVLGSPPQLYEVANVASNTTIGLVTNYTGTSGSGQAYFILATQGWIKELADRAATVIATYASIEQAVDDLELITTLISQADAQDGTRTDVQGWSSLRVRQAANAAITARAGSSANFGTAATANVTTSVTDTTAGRVPTVGWMGLGSGRGVNGPSLTDLNAVVATNISRVSASSSNIPAPHSGHVVTFAESISGSDFYGSQLYISRDADRAFARRSGGSAPTVFQPWYEFFTTSNLLNIGTTPASARSAIQSSVFPAHSKASMPPIAASINMGVIVSDAVGGRRPFWSDGTNWRDASGTILS